MTLLANEILSGGFVRDQDDRIVVVVDGAGGGAGSGNAGIPNGAVPLVASSGNVAATATTATLAAAAAQTTYITGFEVTGAGATAASVILVTVTGTISATAPTYVLAVPAGVTVGATPLVVEFPSPLPGSAVNTAVVVNVPSFGAGNTNAAVVAHGYRL